MQDVLNILFGLAALVAILDYFGIKPKKNTQGIKMQLGRKWKLAIMLALVGFSLALSGYSSYRVRHPKIVEKIVEKPVDRIIEKQVPAECPKVDSNQAKPKAKQGTRKPSAPLPAMTQDCGGGSCAQSSGQTGGVTAGQITVDTPPLKLEWTSSSLPTEALPSITEGSPQKRFKYGQQVTVTPNVAFQPVSLAIICDQEIKEVDAYGAMSNPHFSLAAESNKIGLIYYEAPPLGPGVELTIGIFSDNPFNVVDVKPAKINRRKSP